MYCTYYFNLWELYYSLSLSPSPVSSNSLHVRVKSHKRHSHSYTQIIYLPLIGQASAWIDVPDFASVLTVTGGRVADLTATLVGCE